MAKERDKCVVCEKGFNKNSERVLVSEIKEYGEVNVYHSKCYFKYLAEEDRTHED